MPSLKDHEQDTVKHLGKPFTEVHIALDSYVKMFGALHRFATHHREGIEEIRRRFGDEAALAAECHVRLDCGGRIPSKEDYQTGKVDSMGVEGGAERGEAESKDPVEAKGPGTW